MAKRVTRRQIKSWLMPMRRCFAEMKSGEVAAIRGYAVTRLDHKDEYARIDHCIAGFRALMIRLCPEVAADQLERLEKKLDAGVLLTVAEIDKALTLLKKCENAIIKHSTDAVKDAVLTEQIAIEIDEMREGA